MVFTKLLLENALTIRPCNCGAALEPLLPKVAHCIPVLSSCYIGNCVARVLKRSGLSKLFCRIPLLLQLSLNKLLLYVLTLFSDIVRASSYSKFLEIERNVRQLLPRVTDSVFVLAALIDKKKNCSSLIMWVLIDLPSIYRLIPAKYLLTLNTCQQ